MPRPTNVDETIATLARENYRASRSLGTAVFLALSPAATCAAGWERVADLPESNGRFARALIAGEIVVAGGTNWPGDVQRCLDQNRTYDRGRCPARAA